MSNSVSFVGSNVSSYSIWAEEFKVSWPEFSEVLTLLNEYHSQSSAESARWAPSLVDRKICNLLGSEGSYKNRLTNEDLKQVTDVEALFFKTPRVFDPCYREAYVLLAKGVIEIKSVQCDVGASTYKLVLGGYRSEDRIYSQVSYEDADLLCKMSDFGKKYLSPEPKALNQVRLQHSRWRDAIRGSLEESSPQFQKRLPGFMHPHQRLPPF